MTRRSPMTAKQLRELLDSMKATAVHSSFESQVERLEAICISTPGVLPNRDCDRAPKVGSKAWFAESILFSIRAARHYIEKGETDAAASEVLSIGVLAGQASSLKWSEMCQWREIRESQARESALTGKAMVVIAQADQRCIPLPADQYALDMEVEFRDDKGRLTGRRIALQLKSGDSHLRRRQSDGVEIFKISKADFARYWRDYPVPVFLLVASAGGTVRWMEIRGYLATEFARTGQESKQIIFSGTEFSRESLLEWREKILRSM